MSLKNSIEQEFHNPVRVSAGAPGSLRVLLNGEQIYSKKQDGGSPNAGAIIKAIREKGLT